MPDTCTCPARLDETPIKGYRRYWLSGPARTSPGEHHYEGCPLYVPYAPPPEPEPEPRAFVVVSEFMGDADPVAVALDRQAADAEADRRRAAEYDRWVGTDATLPTFRVDEVPLLQPPATPT